MSLKLNLKCSCLAVNGSRSASARFDCNQFPNMGRTCKYNSSKHKWLSITYVLKTTNQTVRVQTRHKGIMTWRHVLKLYTNAEWCLIRKSGRSWISWISIFWINQLCPRLYFVNKGAFQKKKEVVSLKVSENSDQIWCDEKNERDETRVH